MKKGFVYTILFMVVLSAVLTFALAFSYEAFKPNIQRHQEASLQRAVLYAFNLDKDLKDNMVADAFAANIKEGGLNGAEGYTLLKDGTPAGYAIPFEGSGLWGTIRGYLGVNADLTRTTGLVFTQQNETPGLGGRIDELSYKEQFRDLPLKEGALLRYGQDGIDAITGATQTSSAVLRIVNNLIQQDILAKEGK